MILSKLLDIFCDLTCQKDRISRYLEPRRWNGNFSVWGELLPWYLKGVKDKKLLLGHSVSKQERDKTVHLTRLKKKKKQQKTEEQLVEKKKSRLMQIVGSQIQPKSRTRAPFSSPELPDFFSRMYFKLCLILIKFACLC